MSEDLTTYEPAVILMFAPNNDSDSDRTAILIVLTVVIIAIVAIALSVVRYVCECISFCTVKHTGLLLKMFLLHHGLDEKYTCTRVLV